MSAARSSTRSLVQRCLAARSPLTAPSTASPRIPCHHHFHNSSQLSARRRPRFSNVRAEAMGLVSEQKVDQFTKTHFPKYSPEEKEILAKHYTKEQMEALEAGEATIDPHDLTIQGRLRTDIERPRYVEDFSKILPVVDHRPRTKPPPDMQANFMDPERFSDDFMQWLSGFIPDGVDANSMTDAQVHEFIDKHAPSEVDILKYWDERSSLDRTGESGNTALAPGLMKGVPGVKGMYKRQVDPEDEGMDDTGEYQDAKKKTGMSLREIQAVSTKVIVHRWVHNQTRLGKVRSASIMVIAGNGEGRLGLGVSKSTDPVTAMFKARMAAIKNMKPIPRYEGRTIFGKVREKVSGSVVELVARPPGYGLRVPERIFEMCRAAGIRDLAARIPRSKNPMNTVKATYNALMNQRNPEDIAIGRGKKLVDVRKVYYGGAVY